MVNDSLTELTTVVKYYRNTPGYRPLEAKQAGLGIYVGNNEKFMGYALRRLDITYFKVVPIPVK